MSLDSELREVLAEQADRREGPVPDLAALRAGGLARRRRRLLALASSGASHSPSMLRFIARVESTVRVGMLRSASGCSTPISVSSRSSSSHRTVDDR